MGRGREAEVAGELGRGMGDEWRGKYIRGETAARRSFLRHVACRAAATFVLSVYPAQRRRHRYLVNILKVEWIHRLIYK